LLIPRMIEEASKPLLENPVFEKELHVFLFENLHPVESAVRVKRAYDE
jgi:hypothetical protein